MNDHQLSKVISLELMVASFPSIAVYDMYRRCFDLLWIETRKTLEIEGIIKDNHVRDTSQINKVCGRSYRSSKALDFFVDTDNQEPANFNTTIIS